MKKILLMVLFLFMAVTSVKATTNYFDVTFDEFCPTEYANIDTTTSYVVVTKQYWASRKKHFDQSKAYCMQQQEKDECLKQLRDNERYQSLLYYSSYGIPDTYLPRYGK